jgi:hypothetical protein
VPGLLSPPFCAAIMLDSVEAVDRFWGLRPDDASAFMIVCLGTDSTERALFRWAWNDLGAKNVAGDDGRGAVESFEESPPTVVGVESDADCSLLSMWSVVFRGPNWGVYSLKSEFPMLEGSDLDVGSSSILGRGKLSGLVRAGCMAVGDFKSIA